MSEITQLLFEQFLPSPEKAMADKLRRKKEAEQLAGATQKAGSMDMLEFASQLSNNPGLAKGAPMLAKSTREKYGPVQMGQQGFMIPESGEYTESPMYAESKEADRQQKVLNMAQLTEAANQRAQEANALRLTLGQMNDATRRELAAMADQRARDLAALRGQQTTDRQNAVDEKELSKFTITLDKAGIPEMESALSAVQKRLSMHKEGELPGYGRVQSSVPDMLASDEMQASRADMQQAANIILKSRSGAAVTEPEQLRFLREVGSGKYMDEKTLRRGWANVQATFEAKRANLISGARPEVLQEYNSRTGTAYTHGGKAAPKKKPSEMTDAELEAAIAAARGR